ncbi:NAD(P)H nitroreductase [Ottowia sp. oral taxon 894]|uniref:NAD(P)H-dependent oxidoreductase n=1 Tax=Ottowia sp. oral taxon 894 TaxID=1658672 RepID=UPI00067FE71C|nr:NAD(P)H-dependent oxidoreductase [Ottowia sp. oral taxon 894]AKU67326.1 NAD(P)H nitroreductase [Ottowia sp. oral taxon 894]
MLDKQAILDAYQFRHACKAYDPARKISDDDFRFILETGRLSPSSFGLEPWRFVVVQEPQTRALIRDMAWGAREKVMECSHFVVILARQPAMLSPDGDYLPRFMREVQHLPEEVVQMRLRFFRNFSEKDFELAGHPRAFYDWACKQTYIALGNMLTAAAMIGVDSTAIEGFPLEAMNSALAGRGLYDPAQFKLSVMAAFGYRLNAPQPKTRQRLQDVVQWA